MELELIASLWDNKLTNINLLKLFTSKTRKSTFFIRIFTIFE